MSDHAVYAPSSAERWKHCTASAFAVQQLGKQETNEYAEAGTEAHTEIERVLGIFTRTDKSDKVTSYCRKMMNPNHPAAYGISLFFDFVAGKLGPGDIWVEQRVHLTPEIWGRCDVAHWCHQKETLTIVDYKNGFIDVQPTSPQLKIYAGGTIYKHKLPAKWIRLVVVQPNSIVPGPRVKQIIISADELHKELSELAVVPNGPLKFVPGHHCNYCPAFGMCPATQDLLCHLGAAFARPASEVPSNQIAALLTCKKPIENWFKSLESNGMKKAISGEVPHGMKLVTGVTKRAWKNPTEIRKLIFEQFGFEALDPPTPAQAEERLGLDVSLTASKPPGPPVLAFENDSRAPYVKTDVNKMFADALKDLKK